MTLVRYNRGALPLYDATDQPIDVLERVRSVQEPWAMAEWAAWVHPKGRPHILGRLCAMRLPEKEAAQARERLRREYGSKVSPDMLEAANWVIEFVTVPRERLPLADVFDLYRIRWQVELQIKRDKSVGGMKKLPNFREDTIGTWLHVKLLLQQIVRKIMSAAVVLPPEPSAPPPMRPLAPSTPRPVTPPAPPPPVP